MHLVEDCMRSGALAALVLIASGAAAQLRAQYVERIDVSVAEIDVVVTDRDGNVVRDLTRDDFEVFEEGKKQAITNFSAYDAAALPAADGGSTRDEAKSSAAVRPPPPRLVLLYIDLVDVPRSSRKVFFDGLSTFLDSVLRDGDQLAILGWTHRVRAILSPTSDRARVDAVLKTWSSGERSRDAMAQEIAEKAVAAHAAAVSGESPVVKRVQRQQEEGTETSTWSSFDPATSLAEEIAFQEFVTGEDRCAKHTRKLKSLRAILASLGRTDFQKTFIFASDDVPVDRLLPPSCNLFALTEELATTANAYGITIHGFHPAGERDAFGVADASVQYFPGTQAEAYGSGEAQRSLDESAGLLRLARVTGGVLGRGPRDSVAVMEKVREQSETYYSIGYRLNTGVEDKPRAVQVKVNCRGCRVRAQRSVTRLSEAVRLRDQVVTNLYLPPAAGGSPAFDASVIGMRREGRFRVLKIAVDVSDSELLFSGDRGAAFSIFIAAGREVGDASDISELRYEVPQPTQAGKRRRWEFETRVRPDTRRLSLALRDNATGSVGTRVLDLPAMR